MDATYLSLLIFAIITILYYIFKPKLTLDVINGGEIVTSVQKNPDGTESSIEKILSPDEAMANYTKKGYLYLIVYVLLVIISQFFINVGIIVNKCGGSLNENFAAGAMMTFIPWVFIFGVVVLVLIIFPGFKSAFSNVIGYFAVAGQANTVLNDLLVNANIQEALNRETDPSKKAALQTSAEAIIKLCGNASIMINQIVPENFTQYWSILQPLMKEVYQPSSTTYNKEAEESLKTQLLSVVVMRDNIGEALWYFYTAVLLISVVQYSLSSRGCVIDPKTMAENHQKFVEAEDAKLKQNAKASSQIYAG
jgi:hypothetical protein